jgi:hypothetical protein
MPRLEEGVNVSGHEMSEGWHRRHRSRKGDARHLGRAARHLDQKPDRGDLGAEEGLHTRATLPTDRCHLNDAAVRINRDHRDTPLSGKKTWSSELSASMRICLAIRKPLKKTC